MQQGADKRAAGELEGARPASNTINRRPKVLIHQRLLEQSSILIISKCSADEACQKKSSQDFFDKLNGAYRYRYAPFLMPTYNVTGCSPLALPLGELSPQVTERVLQPFSMPSPSSLRSATSPRGRGKGYSHGTPPKGRGKGYSHGTPKGVRYYYLMRSFQTGCCTALRRSRRRPSVPRGCRSR